MLDNATEEYLQKFPADAHAQIDAVHGIIEKAGPTVTAQAVAESSKQTKDAVASDGLSGFTPGQRLGLYIALICVLGLVVLGSVIAAVFVKAADITPFFTLAGLAVGGITGLFVKSPTSQ